MKRTTKSKLSLHRESLRDLVPSELSNIAAARPQASVHYSCPLSDCCDPSQYVRCLV